MATPGLDPGLDPGAGMTPLTLPHFAVRNLQQSFSIRLEFVQAGSDPSFGSATKSHSTLILASARIFLKRTMSLFTRVSNAAMLIGVVSAPPAAKRSRTFGANRIF